MKPPKIVNNYHGLDHNAVTKKFEGNPTYVGDVCLNLGHPVAVYHSKNPNRAKGHKDYMLISIDSRGGVVMGMDKAEMETHSIHEAVHCLKCNTVLYSVHRHHNNSCGCPNDTFIDGGKDYTRSGGVKKNIVQGIYDVLNNKFTAR